MLRPLGPPLRRKHPVTQANPKERTVQWGVWALTAFIVVAPLAPIAYQSVLDAPLYDDDKRLTMGNFVTLFTSSRMHEVISNTVVFAVLTTVIAVLLGMTIGFLVIRTDMPGRRWLGSTFTLPLYTSALVLAFGWVIVYGPSGYVTLALADWLPFAFPTTWLYTLPGMALVAGVAEAPLVYLFAGRALRSINPALEEAARTLGASPWRILRSIGLPLLRPAALYSVILVFVAALESLSIPLILGGPTGIELFASFLYQEGLGRPNPDYGLLAAASLAMIALAGVLIAIQLRILGDRQRFVTVTGKASSPRRFALGSLRWPAFGAVTLVVVVTCVVPMAGIVLRSVTTLLTPFVPVSEALTSGNYAQLASTPGYRGAIGTSLTVAFLGAALATVLVAAICFVSGRSTFPLRRGLDFLSLVPRALPAVVVSIGVFWAMFLIPGLSLLGGTLWILVLAFTIRFLPLGIGVLAPALMSVSRDLDDAARIAGAGWLRTCRSILTRLSLPALFGAYVVMFAHFLREYASAVYLISPGVNVMGTSMLQLWDQGIVGIVAAFAVIQVAICLGLVFIARRLTGVDIHG
jgi:iron(III) transport system permease protein